MMRLNKYLAHAGVASRRKSDEYIKAGYIKVNGKTVKRLGLVIDEENDTVSFKGKEVEINKQTIYVLLNKPQGYVTTASDEFNRDTVMDLIAIPERIYPVGRLDYETTGLLLLTNDGELTNQLLHPNFKVRKVYRVFLDKVIRPIDLHKLQKGVMLEDKMTLPCKITELRRIDNRSYLEIELNEGRNRQIRKMFALFDYTVEELERISFANLTLGGLKNGEWKYLTKTELKRLKEELKNGY